MRFLPAPSRRIAGIFSGKLGKALLALCLPVLATSVPAQTAHFSSAETTIGSGLSGPYDEAVDGSGNVYIADAGHNRILEETLSKGNYVQSTLTTSSLNGPQGVLVDGSGNVYISDTGNNRILKETLSGGNYTESTVASSSVLSGPRQLAIDASGNLYIADYGNSRIAKATLSGGTYTVATFTTTTSVNNPIGVAVDAAGDVYISDTSNNRVLKETLASGAYTESTVLSGLNAPKRIAVDRSGNVYIPDSGNNRVIKETLSGSTYTPSLVVVSSLSSPASVAVDASGTIYITDHNNNRVLREQLTGGNFGSVAVGTTSSALSLLFTFDTAGTLGAAPLVSGQGAASVDFATTAATTCSTSQSYSAGATCSVAVTFTPTLSALLYGAVVLENLTGGVIATGYVQGTGSGPQVKFLPGTQLTIPSSVLSSPTNPAVSKHGIVYISDANNNRVLRETPAGGGTYTESTVASGTVSAPRQAAVDGSGNVYIADYGNNRIAKETYAGGAYTETALSTSTLSKPTGVAVDGSGNVYVVDSGNNRVLKEALLNGTYSETVVVSSGLNAPSRIAVDGSGNLYISDTGNNRVLEEAVSGGTYIQSTIPSSALSGPRGIAVDINGNIYIADTGNNRVLLEGASGGSYIEFTVATSGLSSPYGLDVDGDGDIYIADSGNNRVVEEDLADAPTLTFPNTTAGTTSSAQAVTIVNTGDLALSFPVPSSGSDPSIAANFTLTASGATTCPIVSSSAGSAGVLAAGISCVLSVSFDPQVSGSISGTLVLKDTNLNAASPSYASQSISLSGTGADVTQTSVAVPTSVTAGQSVTMSAVVSDRTNTGTTPTGGVTFTDTISGNSTTLNGGSAVQLSSGTATLSATLNGVGTHTITASYGGVAGSFAASSGSATTNATGQTDNLAFASIPNQTYGNSPFTVSASSSSSGAITYAVVSGPATISGSTVTLTGTGTVQLSASQVASGNYAAGSATASFTVAPEAPTITFSVPNQTYGAAPFTVAATSNSSGAITYAVVSGPATVSGATVTLTGTGTVVLSATQAANGNYTAGTQNASFTVGDSTFVLTPLTSAGVASSAGSTTTVAPGGIGSYQFSITPGGGQTFSAPVTLTASGLPEGATYSFSPETIPPGSPATISVLTVKTANGSTTIQATKSRDGKELIATGLLLLPLAGWRKLRKAANDLSLLTFLLGALSLGALSGLIGCGSAGFSHNKQQIYTITVTATSGNVSQSTFVTLIEQ